MSRYEYWDELGNDSPLTPIDSLFVGGNQTATGIGSEAGGDWRETPSPTNYMTNLPAVTEIVPDNFLSSPESPLPMTPPSLPQQTPNSSQFLEQMNEDQTWTTLHEPQNLMPMKCKPLRTQQPPSNHLFVGGNQTATGIGSEAGGDWRETPSPTNYMTNLPAVTEIVPDNFLSSPESPLPMTPPSLPQQTPNSSQFLEQMNEDQTWTTLHEPQNLMPMKCKPLRTQQPPSNHLPTEYTVRQSPASGVETTPPSTTQAMVVTSKPISMASFQNTSSLTEQVQLQSSSHTAVVGMLDVPVLHDSEGEYEFSVIIEEKERTTKSPMWLMSRITNKLYTNINKAVPFEIRLKKPIDNDQFCIRAVPVFSSPQFLRTNVTRCPNHAAPTDSTNHDFPYPEHVVRADHPEAHYVKNVSGRLSVVVPLDKLQDGSGYTSILLRFMCLGSCVGGINRRPIAVIITLEDRRGMVYGRKVIDVRVCACPTRDIKTDEQAVLNRGTKRKAPLVQEKVPLVSRKKPRPIEPKAEPQEDDKVFCIPVRGRQLYNFMMEMKAVYYRTHPDYAAKYPDSLTRHTDAEEMKERSCWRSTTDDVEVSTWDSEADSPYRLTYDDSQSDLIDVVSAKSPSSHLQSHNSFPSTVKLKVMEKKRTGEKDVNSVNIESSDLKSWSQTSEAVVNSAEVSPVTVVSSLASVSPVLYSQSASKVGIINLPNVSIPKHVPVVQVSSHREPTFRRSTSEFKFGSKRRFYRNPSANQKQVIKESAKISSDKTETDTSAFHEQQSSPGSPEMLAANVLVEGFAKDKL
ncbi:uncharacterized protein [Panulirus ornatus]|uniref:uncharacterized protein isoform X3 n=1 Tax=Panulirus ornatus TaxID=150431 RepID=UPI003A8B5113